ATALILRRRDRSEVRHMLAIAIDSMEPMAGGWIHIREQNHGRQFALRLTRGRERIYQLPQAQPLQ
ncbi:MAG: hypothetical protein ABI165_11665, partial [Bryobacteraceae bacterium]